MRNEELGMRNKSPLLTQVNVVNQVKGDLGGW